MKKLLITMAIASAALAAASAQTTDTPAARPGNTDTFVAPIAPSPPPVPAPTPEIARESTQGVVPRAMRHGRPWQMLNPGAPARYGQAHDNVTHDPNEPGKPKGIKLFELIF